MIFDFIKRHNQRKQARQEKQLSPLRQIAVFRKLSDKELQLLTDLFIYKSFKQNEMIFKEGYPNVVLYIIQSGRVKLYLQTPHGEIVLAELGATESFGEVGLFTDAERIVSAVAMENTTVIAIKKTDIKDFIRRHPATGIKLLYNIGKIISADFINSNELLRKRELSVESGGLSGVGCC